MLSMKCVVVRPFTPELFHDDVFRASFDKASSYAIKKTKHSQKTYVYVSSTCCRHRLLLLLLLLQAVNVFVLFL